MNARQALSLGIADVIAVKGIVLTDAIIKAIVESQLKQLAKVHQENPQSILDVLAVTPEKK